MPGLGAISFLHRSAPLSPRLVVLDGVFSRGPDGAVRFHEAIHLEPDHWLELHRVVQRRVLRSFRAGGFLDDDHATSMLSWQGSGGFSIDASVRITGDDRTGLERLLRGHRREASVVPDPRSPSNASTHWKVVAIGRPLALSPARGPPQGDFLLDQMPAFDPADAEPDPDFPFDQSLRPDFDD